MISGRVLANYQWSGDAVYSMDEAEADGLYLNFSAPLESTNIYFDGWVMLKMGLQATNKNSMLLKLLLILFQDLIMLFVICIILVTHLLFLVVAILGF